jgi:DNA-binding NarL/FixJ family response regulator
MGRARVLLADDNRDVLDRARQVLGPEFEVVGTATDGHALLDLATQLEPDVVVVDISMPVLGGIPTAWRLRQRGSKMPIVFLTVHEDPHLVQEVLATGALGYVAKTRMVTDLSRAIRRALSGRRFVSPSIELAAGR